VFAINAINCQLSYTVGFIFAYIAFGLSTLLIILRTVAIWKKKKVVVILATIVWVTNTSFLVLGSIRIRSSLVQAQHQCSIPNARSNLPTMISLFITDIVLLVVMLIGLVRMSCHGTDGFSLGRLGSLLWKQGLIWFFLATTVELQPLVFVCLNLNDAFNMMFLMPSLVLMTIASTRMYRILADFSSATEVIMDSGTFPRVGRAVGKLAFAPPNPPQLTEVAVYTTTGQYQETPTDQDSHDGNDRSEQLHDKRLNVNFDSDVERRV